MSILINFRLMVHYRKVMPLLLLFIFTFFYIVPFIYHFYYGIWVSGHKPFNNSYYLGETIKIFYVFLLSIFVFSKREINYIFLRDRIKYYHSPVKFYLLLFIIVLLIHFGLSGENLLNGRYGSIEKNQNPLFEYALIFLAIISCYIGEVRLKRNLLFVVVALLVFKDLIYGGRITSVQVLILTFILFFEGRISKKYIYTFFIIGVLAMRVFVSVRSNPLVFLSGQFGVEDFFISNSYQLNSNQGDIAQASARLLGFVETGILSFQERIESFFYTFASTFTPGYSFSSLDNISLYKQNIYSAGGGALFPIYFFVWLSYFGVVLSGYIISKFLNSFINSTNNYMLLFSCLVISSFPRWVGYNAIVIFKMCLYVVPVYFIVRNFRTKTIITKFQQK